MLSTERGRIKNDSFVAATNFIVTPNASISANNNALTNGKGSGMNPGALKHLDV
jgi:hypothetical protein